ncbi:MAG: LacI family DNA-binding transcriptional regulator [Lachnospiraceae bacterium]|nr:LacI family DNA-binding transcriptional regulator [Lachnospiraceae bacterium]
MSLKKIAEMVGVAPSTVSRVLNNTSYNCASKEMKDKIWEAAKNINYTPNESARSLKKGYSVNKNHYRITIILGRFDTLETDPFFKELFRYIEEELFANQCIIEQIVSSNKLLITTNLESDGYIILGRCSEKILSKLKEKSRNVIGVGRNHTNYDIDEVICDGKNAAILAMEYLISNGYKKIAYIGDCSYENRYIGYCECLMRHNLPIDYSFIYSTNQTEAEGYQVMESLCLKNDISAIFCANDATALGILKYLKKHVKRSKYPAIISIDNIQAAEECTPLLTTVNVPKEDMGRMAVKILLDRIAHHHKENMRVDFPCKLIVRESCPDKKI